MRALRKIAAYSILTVVALFMIGFVLMTVCCLGAVAGYASVGPWSEMFKLLGIVVAGFSVMIGLPFVLEWTEKVLRE